MGRDNRIYGTDSNDMAESIANDALGMSGGAANANNSDYWGSTIDDEAQALGNAESQEDDVYILRKATAGGGDKESLNDSTKGGSRHRPGPSESHEKKDRAPVSQSGMKNQK